MSALKKEKIKIYRGKRGFVMNFKSLKDKLKVVIDIENIIPATILTIIILGTELRKHPMLVLFISFLYSTYRIRKKPPK